MISSKLFSPIIALLILNSMACTSNNQETTSIEEFQEENHNSDLLALVKKNGKYGFINTKGEVVIPLQYDYALSFSEGLACVGKSNRGSISYFFIDKTGNTIINPGVSSASFFLEGYCAIRSGSRICFTDKTGRKFGDYQFANNFREGLALVMEKDGTLGFVDTTGTMTIPIGKGMSFKDAKNFYTNRAVKKSSNGLYGYINSKGEYQIEPIYRLAFDFSNGFARVLKDKQFGFVDSTGNSLTGFGFRDALDFSDGLAAVKKEEQYGFINTSGQVILDYQYYRVKSFGDGLAPVMKKNKRGYAWGYINKKGEWITDAVYSNAQPFKNGFGVFYKREKYTTMGMLNTKGDTVIAPEYDYAANFLHPDSTNDMETVSTAHW